ncbi:DeoR family transcriptional regulator [Streptomyces sp. bgisy082]|uniref:DeoR family transcriptional regulator n=1 Tax=Streptomyces sp. bgisy082 TaxID=3413776 RepID=UPI003D72889F
MGTGDPIPALQRRALILDLVRRDGAVRVTRLVEQLGVSDMTVRRDLEVLARSGSPEKVHGGAVATSTAPPGRSPASRPRSTWSRRPRPPWPRRRPAS